MAQISQVHCQFRVSQFPNYSYLVGEQFRCCGLLYAFRKYLKISILFKHAAHKAVLLSLNHPVTKPIVKHHPRVAFKYLHKYLSLPFDLHTKSTILENHYRFLSEHVRRDFVDRICLGSVHLWEFPAEDDVYRIGLKYPGNEEGELFLIFSKNNVIVYTLSFTIAPGKLLSVDVDQVIFIGRVQGVANKLDEIRHATKVLHDLIPATILLSAVRGIAIALGIPVLIGVSANHQITRKGEPHTAAYDDFWTTSGGKKINDQYYYLPTVQIEKPIGSIKNNHRSRVKRKRYIKNELIEHVSSMFAKQCLQTDIFRNKFR